MVKEWSGSPDPANPANYWIDDETGERVNAETGERHTCLNQLLDEIECGICGMTREPDGTLRDPAIKMSEDELFDFTINVQVLAKNKQEAFDYLSKELDIWRESAFGGYPTNEPPPFVNDFQINPK